MTSAPTAESVVARAIADAIRPDPPLSVWKWADEYRILSSKAASAPGKYRSERTPYLESVQNKQVSEKLDPFHASTKRWCFAVLAS